MTVKPFKYKVHQYKSRLGNMCYLLIVTLNNFFQGCKIDEV